LNAESKQMEASLVFSNLTKSQPVTENVFENFNYQVIKELKSQNMECQSDLISQNIEVLKYLNKTVTLNNTLELKSKAFDKLTTQIQTYEEQVNKVTVEKETTVSEKVRSAMETYLYLMWNKTCARSHETTLRTCTYVAKPSSHWSAATYAWFSTIYGLLLVGYNLCKVVSPKTGVNYVPHAVDKSRKCQKISITKF